MSQLIDDLKATRAELQSRGRITGHCTDRKGCVCLVGAAIAATDPERLHYGTRTNDVREIPRAWAVVLELHKQIEDRFISEGLAVEYNVAAFNDAFMYNDDPVFDLVDDAIEAAEAAA